MGCGSSKKLKDPQEDKKKTVSARKNKIDPIVVAKYDIKAVISKGNFSKIVQAERRISKEMTAIKMVDTSDKKRRDFCNSELEVLQRVKHKYVVRLVEVMKCPETSYIVMEYATGGELFQRIMERGSFSERDAVKILRMVLEAVDYLHAVGITHRDLKPENLLFNHKGNHSKIVVTHFGFAASRRSGDEVTMTEVYGTPEYRAPEMLMGKPYTSAVDDWAVGVITYVLLSGIKPFENDNKHQLNAMIMRGEYNFNGNPWPRVSKAAKDFIAAFLTVNPDYRMTPRQALRHPWVANHSAQSSTNLHRCISMNLLKRAYSRNSDRSSDSGVSIRSQRSQQRTIKTRELDDLLKKYQVGYSTH